MIVHQGRNLCNSRKLDKETSHSSGKRRNNLGSVLFPHGGNYKAKYAGKGRKQNDIGLGGPRGGDLYLAGRPKVNSPREERKVS